MTEVQVRNRHDGGPLRHEPDEVSARRALAAGVGLFGIIAVALLMSWGAYSASRSLSSSPASKPLTFTRPDVLPPPPRLQQDPHADLVRLRAAEDSILTTYGWVDRDSGLVRIPIARAMEMLVEKGLPEGGKGEAQVIQNAK